MVTEYMFANVPAYIQDDNLTCKILIITVTFLPCSVAGIAQPPSHVDVWRPCFIKIAFLKRAVNEVKKAYSCQQSLTMHRVE
jgi:hypothetical protein